MYLYYFAIPTIILQSFAQKHGLELIKCWELVCMMEEAIARREGSCLLPPADPVVPAMEEQRGGAAFRGRGKRGTLPYRGRGNAFNPRAPQMENHDNISVRERGHMHPARGRGQEFPREASGMCCNVTYLRPYQIV